ncbi:VTT domain-containing protein [Lysinibacillus louembei]|uniref:TVP38/TMEM64 family membrane protein n=1 Tax=Lysinibacillus louembei TaxID=1470088 RepID=A0ABZ0RYL4_9BACI|nr:VTT domain-containing protein [Lysinibacillus louembei]WPK12361.1 VTT domain-containing protein [Lysinibacillus louembei]
MRDWFTIANLENIIEQYHLLGPIFGIFLTALEAFIPVLPLVVIVVANVNAYGIILGIVISWVGSVVGAYGLFLVARRFGKHPRLQRLVQNKRVQTLIKWVDMKGLAPILVLLCFPFSPAVIINIVAGLSHIRKYYYLVALIIGKFVMIAVTGGLGYDLRAILTDPKKLILVICGIILLWIIGKWVENKLNKRVERDLRAVSKESHS